MLERLAGLGKRLGPRRHAGRLQRLVEATGAPRAGGQAKEPGGGGESPQARRGLRKQRDRVFATGEKIGQRRQGLRGIAGRGGIDHPPRRSLLGAPHNIVDGLGRNRLSPLSLGSGEPLHRLIDLTELVIEALEKSLRGGGLEGAAVTGFGPVAHPGGEIDLRRHGQVDDRALGSERLRQPGRGRKGLDVEDHQPAMAAGGGDDGLEHRPALGHERIGRAHDRHARRSGKHRHRCRLIEDVARILDRLPIELAPGPGSIRLVGHHVPSNQPEELTGEERLIADQRDDGRRRWRPVVGGAEDFQGGARFGHKGAPRRTPDRGPRHGPRFGSHAV